jgi:phosphoribosyl 1,2-cyclic phosphate phosphodiesterase
LADSYRRDALGTGDATGVPPLCLDLEDCDARERRRRAGLLVETEDRTVLFDASPDLPGQIRETAVDHVDAVFLAHWHHDHAGGIEELGIVSSAVGFDLSLTDVTARHLRTERPHLDGRFEETILQRGEPVTVGDLEVVPFPVAHGRPTFDTLGFAIHGGGGKVVYAPDVERFLPERDGGSAFHGADLLFVEGTGLFRPEIYDTDVDFEAMIATADADRTVLIHLSELFLGLSTAETERQADDLGYEVGHDFATYAP